MSGDRFDLAELEAHLDQAARGTARSVRQNGVALANLRTQCPAGRSRRHRSGTPPRQCVGQLVEQRGLRSRATRQDHGHPPGSPACRQPGGPRAVLRTAPCHEAAPAQPPLRYSRSSILTAPAGTLRSVPRSAGISSLTPTGCSCTSTYPSRPVTARTARNPPGHQPTGATP